ncbi:class I SAM-dependent methyltransferase [Aliifodinibius salicampi]|uniref:Class I SAM-dependent methyltransferase n=1 Tax=Fodinibius salicampi TaxID=1920655 RepID=A0ABT3PUF4_9BACT|nr:class I SAM-dependent methyltransferase [Fodinibius salicampi]MCW9711458.1 class I SAM-dependent methyltransferase [Fodinibius salicampi]
MPKRGKKHTRSRYDLIAPLYNVMEWPIEQLLFKSWRKELWEKITGPQVLEIGVGTGKNIPYYPEGIELTGIDLSPGMLKRAKELLADRQKNRTTLKEMDAQQMDFSDNIFDEVVATFVFCSVPDPILGLKEALRVTKPGGKLHLLEHMRADHSALAFIMDKLDSPIHFLSGVHIARRTVSNVKKAGWDIKNVCDLTSGGIVKRIDARKPH